MKKKAAVVSLVLLALAIAPAFAEGLGLDFGLESMTSDLLYRDQDFGLQLKPFVDYTWGNTGFVFELNWAFPVLPDSNAGWLESWQEYDFSAAGFELAVGNDNIYYLDTEGFTDEKDALEGQIYGVVTYPLPIEGLSLTGEVDTYYAWADSDNNFRLDAIFTPTYTREIGPGTLVAKLRNYFHLYQKDTDAEYTYIELRLSYAMPTGPVRTKFEMRPRLAGERDEFGTPGTVLDTPLELQFVGMITVTYSM